MNLINNAIRATGTGGAITLKAKEEQNGIVIEVIDTGSGIPAAELAHIFERFYRGQGGGLGLGLSIVKELVEAHGGEITVHSEEGKGTRVTVTLP
jgi:signal transduction histidine kinase